MHDDDAVDRLLSATLAAPAPELSPEFTAQVLRRVRQRNVTRTGRVVLVTYALLASATAAWMMGELPPTWIGGGLAACLAVAAATTAYSRRLLPDR